MNHEERASRRRRSPGWVRALSHRSLHGLAGKLQREMQYGTDFSPRQSWLFDACLSELAWRARRDRRDGIYSCSCQFCCGPFDDPASEL